MTTSPSTTGFGSPTRLNRIGLKARPNTSRRTTLPDALEHALSDPDIVSDLMAQGARVSFVADAHCTVGGVRALRRQEFPVGGPSRGVTMAGGTIREIATLGAAGDWDAATSAFVAAFRAASGNDLDVVRIYTLRFIVS